MNWKKIAVDVMFSPAVLALIEIFFVDGGSADSTPIF
jgi:hypothetical protein